MSLISAYFDESGTHEGAPFMCLAGYVFEAQAGADFNRGWTAMLSRYAIPFWHMNESQQLTGPFKGKSKFDVDSAAREAIALIKTHATRGVVLSLRAEHLPLVQQTSAGFFRSPYAFLCWHAVMSVRMWMDSDNFTGQATYIFEAGAAGQGDANDLMRKLFRNEEMRQRYRYRSHAFEDKKVSAQLQAADMLAWHWYKDRQKREGAQRVRGDFISLLGIETWACHFDEQHMLDLVTRMQAYPGELPP